MENELYLPPLLVRRRYLAGKFYLKCRSVANNITTNLIDKLKNYNSSPYWKYRKLPILFSTHLFFDLLPIHSVKVLEMYSLQTWISNINLVDVIRDAIPEMNKAKSYYNCIVLRNICNDYISRSYLDFYKIYTDGSKCNVIGGAAFFDPLTESYIKLKIDSNISIMHIELIAIAEALSYAEVINHDKFVILTDSKSAWQHLGRCTSPMRGIPIAYTILESILNFQRLSKNVILQWIPSHIHLIDNDKVDILAKQAMDDGILFRVTPLYSNYFGLLKKQCIEVWQEYFDKRSKEKGIWYQTIQLQITTLPWIDQTILKRNLLVIALRLRSGHVPSNKFLYLLKKSQSPNCDTCGTIEDVQHILMECIRLESDRIFGVKRTFDVGMCNSILADPLSDVAVKLYQLANKRH
ncbi:hypothetical protein O3G_MSEX010239 [Manduca sexta]|uniref:RNase H type-1 domain-containing protein n=1 Tax=Manduca sexta TaxID=7130 RepID=A0A922CRZ5_MANSE|nr:hypothetical protein O3G_MSEX010239 [Manduca sexta]